MMLQTVHVLELCSAPRLLLLLLLLLRPGVYDRLGDKGGTSWSAASAPQLTKGQVSDPSAALMGRANCDPSPTDNQAGRSIVSSRVPVFRVTSPALQHEYEEQ